MKLKDLTHIPKEVRLKVYERDSYDGCPCCIWCGSPRFVHIHHYIERSRGGKGIEENLVCLCGNCHERLHRGDELIKTYVKTYLSERYEGWNEEMLIARKE